MCLLSFHLFSLFHCSLAVPLLGCAYILLEVLVLCPAVLLSIALYFAALFPPRFQLRFLLGFFLLPFFLPEICSSLPCIPSFYLLTLYPDLFCPMLHLFLTFHFSGLLSADVLNLEFLCLLLSFLLSYFPHFHIFEIFPCFLFLFFRLHPVHL